jgi:hypothetical protein
MGCLQNNMVDKNFHWTLTFSSLIGTLKFLATLIHVGFLIFKFSKSVQFVVFVSNNIFENNSCRFSMFQIMRSKNKTLIK